MNVETPCAPSFSTGLSPFPSSAEDNKNSNLPRGGAGRGKGTGNGNGKQRVVPKGMVSVTEGGEANSFCHPVRPPRKFRPAPSKTALAALASSRTPAPAPPPAPPAPAAAASAVSSGGGGSRTAVVASRSSGRIRDLMKMGGGRGGGGGGVEAAGGRGQGVREVEEGGEEDDDEVCREIRTVWEDLKMVDAAVVHKVVELEGGRRPGSGFRRILCTVVGIWFMASRCDGAVCAGFSYGAGLGRGWGLGGGEGGTNGGRGEEHFFFGTSDCRCLAGRCRLGKGGWGCYSL